MIEDQVLFHLTKFGNSIQSLLSFPPRLKGHDEAVPQGSRFASLNPVLTRSRKGNGARGPGMHGHRSVGPLASTAPTYGAIALRNHRQRLPEMVAAISEKKRATFRRTNSQSPMLVWRNICGRFIQMHSCLCHRRPSKPPPPWPRSVPSATQK